jgi:hypothetical protein
MVFRISDNGLGFCLIFETVTEKLAYDQIISAYPAGLDNVPIEKIWPKSMEPLFTPALPKVSDNEEV